MTTKQEFTNMEKEKKNFFDQVYAEEVDVGLKKNYCEFLNRFSIVILFGFCYRQYYSIGEPNVVR